MNKHLLAPSAAAQGFELQPAFSLIRIPGVKNEAFDEQRVEARVVPAAAAPDEMRGDVSQTEPNQPNPPQSRARQWKT